MSGKILLRQRQTTARSNPEKLKEFIKLRQYLNKLVLLTEISLTRVQEHGSDGSLHNIPQGLGHLQLLQAWAVRLGVGVAGLQSRHGGGLGHVAVGGDALEERGELVDTVHQLGAGVLRKELSALSHSPSYKNAEKTYFFHNFCA